MAQVMTAQPRQTDRQREFLFTLSDFQYLSDLIYQESGIVLKDSKFDMMYARLSRRLRQLGLKDFKSYLAYLDGADGHEEIPSLINAMTTNLTKFFREPHHFDHLRNVALPQSMTRQQDAGGRRLRVWSAACSSGEEAYSAAMVCRDVVPSAGNWDLKILATDLDTNMVERGASGLYAMDDAQQIPQRYHHYLLKKSGDQSKIMINAQVRALIAFKSLNLMNKWPMKGPFDVIFCRNVLIYFDAQTKTRLVRRLAALLREDGFLYLGHSESVNDINDVLDFTGKTIYRKKGGA